MSEEMSEDLSEFRGVSFVEYDGYTVWSFEDDNGTSQILERDCGDYYEVTPFKGVVLDKPQVFMAAAGGEMTTKFKSGLTFSVPITPIKFPKKLDPTEREKAWKEVKEEGVNRIRSDYDKALASAKQQKAVLAIKDVNLGTEPSSDELNKGYNGDIGMGSSSDELMKDNSV